MAVAVLDWDDLAIGAARALSVSQPTMGRRLDALETRMGTKLLLRTPAGHTLTAAGSEILRRVEDVEREVVGMSASPSAATQASAASYA